MPAQLISVAEIARRLNLPNQRLYALVRTGTLLPDATTNRTILFREESIRRVEKALGKLFGTSTASRLSGNGNHSSKLAPTGRSGVEGFKG